MGKGGRGFQGVSSYQKSSKHLHSILIIYRFNWRRRRKRRLLFCIFLSIHVLDRVRLEFLREVVTEYNAMFRNWRNPYSFATCPDCMFSTQWCYSKCLQKCISSAVLYTVVKHGALYWGIPAQAWRELFWGCEIRARSLKEDIHEPSHCVFLAS